MHYVVLDLETTSVDTSSAEVVQCALLKRDGDSWCKFFRPRGAIPADAAAVHGITADAVEDCEHFSTAAKKVSEIIGDTTLITYNGNAFDLPIARRILRLPLAGPHVDLYRVWQVARDHNLASPNGADLPRASRFTGALGSAAAWLTGAEPSGEHDALEDCRMTAHLAEVLIARYGLECCLTWSAGPLPGYVDYASKLRWRGDVPTFTFGKHKDRSLSAVCQCDRGWLMWILRSDFHEDTKRIIREALDGRMPVR
jgi:DNA polymerase-3 subunit epsilon